MLRCQQGDEGQTNCKAQPRLLDGKDNQRLQLLCYQMGVVGYVGLKKITGSNYIMFGACTSAEKGLKQLQIEE